ncbi:MAG TPA: hypothetical protein VKV26_15255 [Dehalococcoidia bacterium]|nr:hypothetical protein [Dehalococcoidia bacterium]
MGLRRSLAAASPIFGSSAPLWTAALPAVAFVAATLQLALSAVDPDYWWHLTTGRWILDHSRIPTTDPFSFTHAGQNWYAHEWLSELALALADKIAGYSGGILLTAVIVAAGAWLLGRAARYYGATSLEAFLLVCGGSFFILPNIAVRPQVFGWALFALVLHELAAHDSGVRPRLWQLAPIFLLWINVHLSALMGGGAVALYVLHRALRWWFSRGSERGCEWRRLRHAFLAAALAALALCLNPRGPALIWFSRTYLNPHAVRLRYIGEWQRPSFSGDDRWLFAAAAGIVVLTLLTALWQRRLWPGVLALVFAASALRATRYGPLFGIVAIPAAGWVVARFRLRRGLPVARPAPRILWAGLALCTLPAIWAGAWLRGPSQFRRVPDAHVGGYPVDAAAWVQQHRPRPRLFNEYGWGGFLIYTFAPDRAVYMDGREEMYGERFFDHFVRTIDAEPGWQQTLRDAKIDAAILAPGGALATAMDNDPGWRRTYGDAVAVVYVPSDTTAKRP